MLNNADENYNLAKGYFEAYSSAYKKGCKSELQPNLDKAKHYGDLALEAEEEYNFDVLGTDREQEHKARELLDRIDRALWAREANANDNDNANSDEDDAPIVTDDYAIAEDYRRQGNYAGAIDYYKKAAEAGHSGAQYQLGKMYYEGAVVTRNANEGLRLLREAAKKRNDGQINAAALEMLEDIAAEQKEKDRLAEEKVNQFLKSVGDSQKKAEQDDIQGMYQRGLSALSNKNYQSAYDSLYAAAEAGHVKAMTTLGKLMFDPTFVWKTKKNPMQKGAVDLLRLAYEKGDQEAGQQLREISGAAYEVKRQEKEAAERKAEAKAKAERMREKRRAENDAHRAKMAEEQAKRAEASRAAREREERAAAERLSAQRIADLNKNTWGG